MARILAGLAALVVAAAIWLPCLHLVFTRPLSDFRQNQGLSPKARQLAARHLQLWTDPALRNQELMPIKMKTQKQSLYPFWVKFRNLPNNPLISGLIRLNPGNSALCKFVYKSPN